MLWETLFFGLSIIIYVLFLIEKRYKPFMKNSKYVSKIFGTKNEEKPNNPESLWEDGFVKQILNSWSNSFSSFLFTGKILETYLFGSRLLLNTLSVFIGYIIALLVLQPFFYKQDKSIKSPYEYLERRFPKNSGKILRILCSFVGNFFYLAFLTLNLWGSAIILSILVPIQLQISAAIIGSISLIFNLRGHLNQFVFVNYLQFICVTSGLIIAVFYDLLENDHGSAPELYDIAERFGRLKIIDTSFDFTTKYTIWNQLFSAPFSWAAFHCFLPTNFKRMRSASTSLKSKILIVSNAPIILIVNILLALAGVMSFVHFHGCDPILIKKFDDKNQLGPFWLTQALDNKFPFMTGIVFSCLILNSIYQHSNGMVTLRNTVYDDMLKPMADYLNIKLASLDDIQLKMYIGLNLLSLICAMLFTYARNSLLSLFYLFNNTLNPPLFALMFLSIINPYANFFGVVITFVISILISASLSFGRIYFLNYSTPEFEPNTFLCENDTLIRNNALNNTAVNSAFAYYSVSSLWYPLFSFSFIFIFGSLLSIIYSFIERKISSVYKAKNNQNKEYVELRF